MQWNFYAIERPTIPLSPNNPHYAHVWDPISLATTLQAWDLIILSQAYKLYAQVDISITCIYRPQANSPVQPTAILMNSQTKDMGLTRQMHVNFRHKIKHFFGYHALGPKEHVQPALKPVLFFSNTCVFYLMH